MKRLLHLPRVMAILGLTLLVSLTAHADQAADQEFRDFSKMKPSATMEFDVTSVKLLAGVAWGKGTLHYQGKSYPLKVSAGSAGGIGLRNVKGTGEVFDLNRLEDFPGIYGGGTVGATAGNKGGGISTIENGKGVVIKASATESTGVQVSLSAGGLKIEFDE